ncbi:hypothetical protein BBAD15_g5721 [Beauveria bassiana D1-5]|uniref:Uncharacterized protein n=1 Tax=Beauveria bassiana D1-5 TaxID=1245745 RepID=A0A0A2VRZ3_BEABA|nr:hypothetical protein BBAD15_g5721 [Beauveria bassiana D1-5]
MRFTVLATFIALAAAESFPSFSDPSSSSSSSSFSSASSSSSFSSSPPDDDDFASHYVAYYSQYQLGRLATFRASYSGNDSLTEVQDAVLSRLETAVATGNASEIAAVKDLCIGTFGLASCRKLAGAEDESHDVVTPDMHMHRAQRDHHE